MTDIVTENGEVAGYLAAIQAALADLPAQDFDDLIEDLQAHLYEVLAESGGASLEASLGSPTAYAAELRASAGLDPAPTSELPLLRRVERRVSTSPVWHAFGRTLERRWVREVRTFLPTLRPGWWVLRGWLALFAVVVFVHGEVIRSYRDAILVPTYHGNWVIGLISALIAILASIWLGLGSDRHPRWLRTAVVAGDLVVVVFFTVHFGDLQNITQGYDEARFYPGPAPVAPHPVGLVLDGRRLENIYPYDEQGHLLTHVRLFDQQGKPLQGLTGTQADGQQLVRLLPSDAAGALLSNEYPQVVGAAPLDKLLRFITPGQALAGSGPNAKGAYAISTPMPTPTVFVPPMAGATPTPTTTAAPTPSLTPEAKTSVPATAKATAKAKAKAPAKAKPKPTSS